MDAATVSAIGGNEVSTPVGLSTKAATTVQPPTGSLAEDTVELSPARIALSRADGESCLALARICEIRAKIKAGTFITAERMDGTVERLLEIGLASKSLRGCDSKEA